MRLYKHEWSKTLRKVYLFSNHENGLFMTTNNNRLIFHVCSNRLSNENLPDKVTEIQSSDLTPLEKYAIFSIIFDDDAVSTETKEIFFEMVKS